MYNSVDTFRSSFLAISIEEAQAFMEYQELLTLLK